jgi:sec-independent protein translocase protein TatA
VRHSSHLCAVPEAWQSNLVPHESAPAHVQSFSAEETLVTPLFAFFEFALSPSHLVLVLVAGVLLFGKRLPEIGRHVGKGIVEFKKGLHGLEDDVQDHARPPASGQPKDPIA